MAYARLWLVAVILVINGVLLARWQIDVYLHYPYAYRFDPGPIFYLAGAVGLVLRLFWARYLAICFAAAITAVHFFCGPEPLITLAGGGVGIALLSGSTMRGLFEEKAARLNRWAAARDRRIDRLRLLFIAQSVVIGLLFAVRDGLRGATVLVLVAGLTLGGLVLQRIWALLAIAPIILLEGWLAARTLVVDVPYLRMPVWSLAAVLLVACGVSLVVIAPLLRVVGQTLREPDAGR